jgi:chitinase
MSPAIRPQDIPLGYYTHINFAFAVIDPNSFAMADMYPSIAPLYDQVTSLKQQQQGLQTWISIGGYSFNDPGPTETTFSTLAASSSAQSSFFTSLISYMQKYGFDGVDIDWYSRNIAPIGRS